ncbi:MOSC domain-containing protein [Streptomyces sp. NPDC127098]|uniref:MOSC domain-containing protein n=1 Tax=Streptomyces sp. NPDC127098 TaxID=3347137 RepID=UPI0036624FD4
MTAVVTGLWHYPVKGCAGTRVTEAPLTPAGLRHDRGFVVVDGDGVTRTQRRHPRLAAVRPEITPDGARLTLRAPGHEPVSVAVTTHGPTGPVDLFGTAFRGVDQGETAADWLSEVLGAHSRLARVPPDHHRVTDGLTPGTSGYADSCPIHLLSTATLDLLDRRLADRGEPPLPVDRFRPNIVVDGWPEPHTEDRVRHLTVGETELGYAKLAIRCAVTMVDQETGRRAGPEPLRTLAGYRRAAEGGVAFGAKFAVLRAGRVRLGDTVTAGTRGERAAP